MVMTQPNEQGSEHGPDWSDWGMDHPEEGPGCRCGFNGTPEECASSRSNEQGFHEDA